MILILIPLAAAFLGLGLWAAMRGLGIMNLPGADGGGSGSGASSRARAQAVPGYERPRATSVREWLAGIRPGCLVAIIAVAAVWILGWLIVLIVGISFLS